jgi:hypothetical protein
MLHATSQKRENWFAVPRRLAAEPERVPHTPAVMRELIPRFSLVGTASDRSHSDGEPVSRGPPRGPYIGFSEPDESHKIPKLLINIWLNTASKLLLDV